jgi:hypothetical protein
VARFLHVPRTKGNSPHANLLLKILIVGIGEDLKKMEGERGGRERAKGKEQ